LGFEESFHQQDRAHGNEYVLSEEIADVFSRGRVRADIVFVSR